jgi:cytoskeletal protein RodZ
MDDIKVLKEIGLKKVSNETHIEQKYLQYMVNCDFDKLDYVNTLGFIKILSREYNVDLSEFREAFEEYWNENRRSDEDEGLFIVVENSSKGTKKFLIFILVIVLVATIGMLFSIFKDKIDFTTDGSVAKEIAIEPQNEITKNAQDTLEKAMEINNTQEDIIVSKEDNETSDTIKQTDDLQNEKTEDSSILNSNENLTEEKVVIEKSSKRFEKEAIIVPNTKLWVGVIYLDNKKRRSYLGEGNFSIDLSKEQIITTGHGSFSLHVNDKIIEYNQEAPVRFWVKDENITKIRWSKFKELNEGMPW